MFLKRFVVVFTLCSLLLCHQAFAAGFGQPIQIADRSGKALLTVKQDGPSKWIAKADGRKFVLKRKSAQKSVLIRPDGTKLKVKHKEDKVKLKQGNKLLLKVKFKPGKVKVATNEEMDDAWKFTKKNGKIKVKRGDRKLGQVVVDTKSGKLVAMDGKKSVVAVCDSGVPEFALAPVLISESLSEPQVIFLVLLLCSMGL
ncbi:hypothetical protein ACFL2Q_18275 [Thermodesulfobacteriota bacterium]